MKRLIVAIFVSIFAVALLPHSDAQAADQVASWDVHLVVNGQSYQPTDEEGKPYINTQGRTMIPVRVVGQALGFTVDFKDGQVLLENKELPLKARFFLGKNYFEANQVRHEMDSKMVVSDKGRSYFPLRALVGIQAQVHWDAATRTVDITGNFSKTKNFTQPGSRDKYTLVTDKGKRVVKLSATNAADQKYYSFSAEDAKYISEKSRINKLVTYNNTDYIGIWSGITLDTGLAYYQVPKDSSQPLKYIGFANTTSDIILSDQYFYSTDGSPHGGPDVKPNRLFKDPIGVRGEGEKIEASVAINNSRFFINDKDELWARSPEGTETKILDKA